MDYLQKERNYNILNGISRILQQNKLLGAESLSLLADKTVSKSTWTTVIMDRYDSRSIPIYNSELITRINTAYQQECQQLNSSRKKLIEHIEKEINIRKKQLNDAGTEMRKKHTDTIRAYTEWQVAITNNLPENEIYKFHFQKQALEKSYRAELAYYQARHSQLKNELISLQQQLSPILLVSSASNQRHFFLTSEDCNMGYNPYTDQFEMVIKTSQPQEPHILRCAAHHPQQKLFNLPLSLLNLLNYADRIGCSDAMLKTILIIFLQKHQPLLVDSVDPHSLTTREFLQNITFNINTTGEKLKALQALKKFTRNVGQSFSASVTNFEALFSFYIQLDSVVPPEETSRLNLSNLIIIAPHLISRRCRPVYHEWYRDRIRSGDPPTKVDIFRIIESLENNTELMIEENTFIPYHITLNIVNEHETVLLPEVTAPTFAAYPTTSVTTSISSGSSTFT